MTSIQKKILAVYLLVLLMGSTLSVLIYVNGRAVQDTASGLVEHSLPRLDSISKLRVAIFDLKPILYEYYATRDRDKFTTRFEQNQRAIDAGLRTIRHTHSDEHLSHIASERETLNQLAEQLDATLKVNDVDWDRARELLTRVTAVEESVVPDINALVQATQEQVHTGGAQVNARTRWMTGMVVGFSAVIFAIAVLVGYYVNVYLRETAERKRLAMFAERNPHPVLRLARDGAVLYANHAARSLYTQLELGSAEKLLPADIHTRLGAMAHSKQNDLRTEYSVAERVLDCEIQVLPDLDTCHAYLSDITERKHAEQSLVHQAYHDAVTGLPNRRQFYETLAQTLAHTAANTLSAVLLLRLDRIKLVLESQGYETSDNLLHAVAQRFAHLLSHRSFNGARLFRFEGATFSVVLPDAAHAERLANELQQSMREPVRAEAREYFFTLSIGASVSPQDGRDARALIRSAEAAVNQVQNKGGNAFARYTQDMHRKAEKWLDVESALRRALDRDEFVLHYQPQASLDDGRIVGMEALIRWRRDGGAFVSPMEFIPIAEETGLILPIGEWVLRSACIQARAWHHAGHSDLVVAVNISARQFQHPEFVALVTRTLADTGMAPHTLELEITESAAMQDAEKTIATLNELRALGLQLSIDDFGTGYSSLSYLKRFPLAKLKVDQSFVRNLSTHINDAAIARAVILLGQSLKLKVIAEGVETEAQLAWLKDAGCEEMQGYLFSRPVSAQDIDTLLRSGKRLGLPTKTAERVVHARTTLA